MFLTFTYQSRHIGNILFDGSDFPDKSGIHVIYHTSFVVLHVDYHGIQFRPVHQSDKIIHIGGSGHSSGNINPLHPDFFRKRFRYRFFLRFCFPIPGFCFRALYGIGICIRPGPVIRIF